MTKGMTVINDQLYRYIHEVSLRETTIQKALREETERLGQISRMQIAPEQGQFLTLLVELLNAKLIVEVGTFTGYSALCLASALPDNGRLIACDVSEEWTGLAKEYWEQAQVASKIELCIAPAAETLQKLCNDGLAGQVDLVFIDADKANYDTYYELALQLLRPNGLILIDNTLWGGDVANSSIQDKDTNAIRALNHKIHVDERVSISLLTLADGLTLARKR